MERKMPSAIMGVIIMVVATVIIAAAVFIYVENMREEVKTIKEIKISPYVYWANETGVGFKIVTFNENDQTNASVYVAISSVTIKDRVVEKRARIYDATINVTIGKAYSIETVKILNDDSLLDENTTYSIEYTVTILDKEYPTQTLYIFPEQF